MNRLLRRIHTIRAPRRVGSWFDSPVYLNERGSDAFPALTEFVAKNGPIKFSRRKFAGATPVVFKANKRHWWNGSWSNGDVPVFTAKVGSRYISVCGNKSKIYFGVNKDTKEVTIWYKKVSA